MAHDGCGHAQGHIHHLCLTDSLSSWLNTTLDIASGLNPGEEQFIYALTRELNRDRDWKW